MSIFKSKKAQKKVKYPLEISPDLQDRIKTIKDTLFIVDSDLEFLPEFDLERELEKLVKKAEIAIKDMEKNISEKQKNSSDGDKTNG